MPNAHLWYADGPDSPRTSPADVLAAAGYDDGTIADITIGWTIHRLAWMEDPSFRARTVLAGYGLSGGVNDGRITALPVRLSAVPSMIEENPPDVAVVTGIRRGDTFAFGSSVGWGDVLARCASRVVVEIDADGIDLGGPVITGNIVATVDAPPPPAEPGSLAPRRCDRPAHRMHSSPRCCPTARRCSSVPAGSVRASPTPSTGPCASGRAS